MTDDSGKRVVIRLCTAEAIEMIEKLPRGYKSMIVEHAFNTYLESIPGQKLIKQLKERKKKHIRAPVSSQVKENTVQATYKSEEKTAQARSRQEDTAFFEKLIGDF